MPGCSCKGTASFKLCDAHFSRRWTPEHHAPLESSQRHDILQHMLGSYKRCHIGVFATGGNAGDGCNTGPVSSPVQLTLGGMAGCTGPAESSTSLASEARASVRLLERGGRWLSSPSPRPPSMSSSGVGFANTSSLGSWPGCSRLCSGTVCSAGAAAGIAGSPGAAAAVGGSAGACCTGCD